MRRRDFLGGLAASPLVGWAAAADGPGDLPPRPDDFTRIHPVMAASLRAARVAPVAPGWYDTVPPDNAGILRLNLEFLRRLNALRADHVVGPDVPAETRRVALDAVRRSGVLPRLELEVLCAWLARVVVEDNARTLRNTAAAISHRDSLGRWPHDRLLPFDRSRAWDSEVLSAGGDGSIIDPFEGWILSPGHRAVILHPKARRCGLWFDVQDEPRSPYRWFDGSLRRWGCVLTS